MGIPLLVRHYLKIETVPWPLGRYDRILPNFSHILPGCDYFYGTWGPFHKWFFHCNSNTMEISFYSHLDSNTVIASKVCAKICCDLMASNGHMVRRSFHRIWIAQVKRAPGQWYPFSGLILGLHPLNERRRYKVNTISRWLGPRLGSAPPFVLWMNHSDPPLLTI